MKQTNYRELPKVIRQYIKSIDKSLQVRRAGDYYTIVDITNNNGERFTPAQEESLKKLNISHGSNFAVISTDNFKDYMKQWNLEIPMEEF